jgi:hypothetical protein
VGPDGLPRVGRTGWVEPAPPAEHRPEGRPVDADGSQQDRPQGPPRDPRRAAESLPHGIIPARVNRSSISRTRSWFLARPNGPRATNTTSWPCEVRGQSCRQASRSRRLARLRATAPPTRLPATHAARDEPVPGARYSITRLDRWGVPLRRTRRMSRPARNLGGEPGAALGPSPGQDPATRPGAHPHPEPVGSLATAVVGLEGPLHRPKKSNKVSGSPVGAGHRGAVSGPEFGRNRPRVYAPPELLHGVAARRPRFTSPPKCTPVEKGCG